MAPLCLYCGPEHVQSTQKPARQLLAFSLQPKTSQPKLALARGSPHRDAQKQRAYAEGQQARACVRGFALATCTLLLYPDHDCNTHTCVCVWRTQFEMDDVLGDAALFDALGVGLGRQEAYNVALACKKLGEDPKRAVATVRFFGKFFGLYADYYVFETTLKETPEIPEAPGTHTHTHTHTHTFFVVSFAI